MISPWDVIGWILVAIVIMILAKPIIVMIWFFGKMILEMVGVGKGLFRYYMTRNTPPAAGQSWTFYPYNIFNNIEVVGINDNGNIMVRGHGSTWGIQKKYWTQQVKRRKMYLKN